MNLGDFLEKVPSNQSHPDLLHTSQSNAVQDRRFGVFDDNSNTMLRHQLTIRYPSNRHSNKCADQNHRRGPGSVS